MSKLLKLSITIMLTMINLGALLLTSIALADHLGPEVKTQVNQQSDLFEQSINDLQALKQQLMEKQQDNINSMGDGSQLPPALNVLTNKGELESESSKLQAISEHDLEALGRQELIKQNMMSLHPDYSHPGYSRYLKDAESLAVAQDSLLSNLLGKLKELGIDCKTVKGDQRHEPEYYLQIRQQQVKDTVYNQVFCESLRNRYLCHDRLMMNCKTKGIQKGVAQPKVVNLGAMDLWNLAVFNGEDYEQRGNTYEDAKLVLKIRLDATSIPVIKNWLALKEGVSNDFIDNIKVSYHGGIMFMNLDSRKHGFTTYRLDYEVAKKHEICLEWQEEWIEQCILEQ